jgi:ADP-ribosylglycohydrolase
LALARALIRKGLDINEIARQHVIPYEESTLGWGRSTRDAIKAIKDGQNPQTASSTRGVGNGVVMKLPPLAAYLELEGESYLNHHEFIRELTFMTHSTSLAFAASMAHLAALSYCLRSDPINFNRNDFINEILIASEYAQKIFPTPVGQDNIFERLQS